MSEKNAVAKANEVPEWMKNAQQNQDELPEPEQSFTPRLKLIQSISPQRAKDDEKYIPGAEEGMLFIDGSAPRLLDGDSVEVIPLFIAEVYYEFVPRKKGGGFEGRYTSREAMEAEFTPGNEAVKGFEVYCLIAGSDEPISVVFDSPSKYGVYNKWAQLIKDVGVVYGRTYTVGSERRKNKAGDAYYNYTITPGEFVSQEFFMQVKDGLEGMKKDLLPAPDQSEDSEV